MQVAHDECQLPAQAQATLRHFLRSEPGCAGHFQRHGGLQGARAQRTLERHHHHWDDGANSGRFDSPVDDAHDVGVALQTEDFHLVQQRGVISLGPFDGVVHDRVHHALCTAVDEVEIAE
jgi:hypothetical protein